MLGRRRGRRRVLPHARMVDVDGLDLYYLRSTGTGADRATVILVHGLGLSTASMLPLLRCLEPDLDVLVPDLPGYGRSEQPRHVPTVPQFADTLARFAKALEVRSAVFVGSSLGAQIVAHLAGRYPELVDGAVLVGPTRDPAAPHAWQQALRLLRDVPHERISLLGLAATSYLRAGPRTMWQLLRHSVRRAVEQGLPAIEAPVLIVRGEHDPVAGQEWVEAMHRLITDSELCVLPGAGHAPNYSQPEELAEVIRPFVARCLQRDGRGDGDLAASTAT